MLGANDESNFIDLIDQYPLGVKIPPQIQLELRERGPAATRSDDTRVATRFRCNGPAILEWLASPSGLPVQFPTAQVVVRNLSRTGFAVLTERQWFPEQVAKIILPTAIVKAKVIRARRLGRQCYDIGFRVASYTIMETGESK